MTRQEQFLTTWCRESPVPQKGLILPTAAVSPHWDSKTQPSSLAVPVVALMAAARVSDSYGGEHEGHPFHLSVVRGQPKPGIDSGVQDVWSDTSQL